jgi:hypothetical protein
MQCVLGVRFHPVARRPLQLRRGRNNTPDASSGEGPCQPETRRTCFINGGHRSRWTAEPLQDLVMSRSKPDGQKSRPLLVSNAQPITDRAWTSNRTLVRSSIAGTSQFQMWLYPSAKCGRQPTFCFEKEVPAQNPAASYRLVRLRSGSR